jgi:hypothetical protein
MIPDLQEWLARYGGYWEIPWDRWDAAMERAGMYPRYASEKSWWFRRLKTGWIDGAIMKDGR